VPLLSRILPKAPPPLTSVTCAFGIQNKDGLGVIQKMCVTAPKPGRKVVVMGNSSATPSPASAFMQQARNADVMVSGAVAPPSSATGLVSSSAALGMRAADLGRLAALLGADHLLLARLDMR